MIPELRSPGDGPPGRSLLDAAGLRQRIFDRALESARAMPPVSNQRHTLALHDIDYTGPSEFSPAEQKRAVLTGGTLHRKLAGTWVLTDTASGREVARRRMTIARIPWLSDRGVFTLNGTTTGLAHQTRLLPGVYARQRANGEIEAHVNVAKGLGHRIAMDPATGVFHFELGQSRVPLMPVLRAMGANDRQLREAWGAEIAAANAAKDDNTALRRLYAKLKRADAPDDETARQGIAAVLAELEVDPEVTTRTLGGPFSKVDPSLLLEATRKILRINKGEEDPDDRDALQYQRLLGPEDLLAERFAQAQGVARKILWKASARQSLDGVPSNAYGEAVRAAIVHSGLGNPLEEINPLEILDQRTRVTRTGEGGIESNEAVPLESRAVQPTQLGFVDFLRTPERGKVGVDSRLAQGVRIGEDGRPYIALRDARGRTTWRSPRDIGDAVLAFPGEREAAMREGRLATVIVKGQMDEVAPEAIDYELPRMDEAFSPVGALVPLRGLLKPQRAVMAARMLTQALPLEGGEAPLVQSGYDDGTPLTPGNYEAAESYEGRLGEHVGAVRAQAGGVVERVTPDEIVVRDEGGQRRRIQLYNNFPHNRKTPYHQEPVVAPGDRYQPGQLLARSNYTDADGSVAMGLNARTAYMPWEGANYEDAIVVSRSFADRARSQHMYQHSHDWDPGDRPGKRAFIAAFPGEHSRAMLDNYDDEGIIKPGTKVTSGMPLALVVRERESNRKSLLAGRPTMQNVSPTWDHHDDGVVTDAARTDQGLNIVVRTTSGLNIGDKMSGRHGDKGVIGAIVPDEQMPQGADGKPFEVLLNPLGLTSRTNPSQIIEAALGKIAAARGRPYKVRDWQFDVDGATEWALRELARHGIPEKEAVVDPRSGRRIPNVFTGNRWLMKLSHTTESKMQGRGLGGYSADMAPAGNSKRVGMLELNGLISHGAVETIRDIKLVRGQANPDQWARFMSGGNLPPSRVPWAYVKYINQLKAAGIHPVRQGTRTHFMAMTDKAIDELSDGRELKNADTVDWKTMAPIPGGLFDERLTGGHMTTHGGGDRWAVIPLHEPLPNPVMEEPIRHVLGLTKPKFEAVLAGQESLATGSGPAGMARALAAIDLDSAIHKCTEDVRSGKKGARDVAIRKLRVLTTARRQGLHPKDWFWTKAPVLPPAFRPVSAMGPNRTPLVADPNYLYRELWDANQRWRELASQLSEDDVADERLGTYQALKAVVGLGAPTHPKNQEREVRGILKHVFGRSPKFGTVQRRLLGGSTDLVGRAVIAPDANLDMDSVGIPENMAWEVYRPLLMRRMARRGRPAAAAARAIEERSPEARQALMDEMRDGVVMISRAPTLHKYGIMAFRPQLAAGDTMRISPIVTAGFGADFDGDAMNVHVAADERAREEQLARMLPSRNLFSAGSFGVHYLPRHEFLGGLYQASAPADPKKPPRTFRSRKDAIAAWRRGEVRVDQHVRILED